jgi:hypothetical protein
LRESAAIKRDGARQPDERRPPCCEPDLINVWTRETIPIAAMGESRISVCAETTAPIGAGSRKHYCIVARECVTYFFVAQSFFDS